MSSGGGGSSVTPPALLQTNIPQAQSQALAADQESYLLSDRDYANRFPQLTAGRNYNINNAASDLAGHQDPAVTNALRQSGFGNVNLGSNSFQQSRSLGQPVLSMEQRNNNYFQTLLSDNPERAFGLSGGDVANIALGNVGAANAYNTGTYSTRIQGYNQNIMQNAQNSAAMFSALGSLGRIGAQGYSNYNNSSPYLSANQYVYSGNVPYFAGTDGASSVPSANFGGGD